MWTWPTKVSTKMPDGTRLTLRPMQRNDREAWDAMRARNFEWLKPWESTNPRGVDNVSPPFSRLRRSYDRAAREGRLVPFVIDAGEGPVGQMHLFEIQWGARWTASAGYWLDQSVTGRGLATWALAMLLDHGLTDVGLHRIEINIRPENTASIKVVERLGLTPEGMREGLIFVDGAWRDHLTYVVTAEHRYAGHMVRALKLGELRETTDWDPHN